MARIAGGEVPGDRPIDRVDQTDLFLGRQKASNREGFTVYQGDEVFGVKWRNWKLNFKEQDTVFSEVREYLTPRAYNLLTDPGETYNILFPHTWVRRRRWGNWKSTGGHWRHTHPFGRERPIRINQAGDEMMVASD